MTNRRDGTVGLETPFVEEAEDHRLSGEVLGNAIRTSRRRSSFPNLTRPSKTWLS